MNRYYAGDASDLDGLTREEVIDQTVGTWEEAEDLYRDLLNDLYGEIQVCGLTFWAGDVLESVDPTAFRVGMSDHIAEIDPDDYEEEEEEKEEEEED